MPSREWALTAPSGEHFNTLLRLHLVEMLRFAEPRPLPCSFRNVTTGKGSGGRDGLTWSERHAAYAAGLGTFSLNDGLITDKGLPTVAVASSRT
jgi:epoxyqueuosine reductase QueG